MKWIPLKERKPNDGQIVMLLYKTYRMTPVYQRPPYYPTTLSPDVPASYPLEQKILVVRWTTEETGQEESLFTHWLPAPSLPSLADQNLEAMRQIDPDLYARCNVFEQQLRKKAPRINWTVSPYMRGTLEQGFKIRGTIDLDVEEVGAEVIARDQMLYSELLDALDYILYQIARIIAQEFTKP